ncbi:AraC family transcriptional regulator [Bacillus tianshenii]|uniref:helix-turn-helix domain-containing protein n=1 Tax=Sutcliffiella tianshenii TaxID=1463404 RepID=UPI001CD3BCBF|nr:AraC family transcriptional regulator [Bacillus tianshenii]MCA1318488.1 AraC family transcriptional regulator [Bacillus tianshenii]
MKGQIVCEKRSYSNEFLSHEHEFGQFLFPLQGSLHMQTKSQVITLEPDHCYYLPPKHNHVFRSTDRNEFLILDIPSHFLPGETESLYTRLDKQWNAIRFLLLEEASLKESDPSALKDLTSYVTRKLQVSVSASIDYIHRHFRESISLQALAEMEHYHPVYYSSWFKMKTGKSPKTYIAELRMGHAKQLLLTTTWPISRISEEVGFENSSSFTRWFVKSEGLPPQKYRMLNNG